MIPCKLQFKNLCLHAKILIVNTSKLNLWCFHAKILIVNIFKLHLWCFCSLFLQADLPDQMLGGLENAYRLSTARKNKTVEADLDKAQVSTGIEESAYLTLQKGGGMDGWVNGRWMGGWVS